MNLNSIIFIQPFLHSIGMAVYMEECQSPSIMPICLALEVRLSLQTALYSGVVIGLVHGVRIMKMLG